jgi:hypothetical protein
MRVFLLSAAMSIGVAATPALAQPLTPQGVPPGTSPTTGARPGNDVGTGMSMPMGNRASNIDRRDTNQVIAPNLPSPGVGDSASIIAYLRAAQGALAGGRTGEAQQSLEMAQTRMLDRSVPLGQTNTPSDNPAVQQVSQALRALAGGDRAACMSMIEAAMATEGAVRR